MDSQNSLNRFEDKRMKELEQITFSCSSKRQDSLFSLPSKKQDGKLHEDANLSGDRSQTRTRKPNLDPDQDKVSDQDHSSNSLYSDDYENVSLSEKSFSPRSPTPSPTRGGRTKKVSSGHLHQTGVCKGMPRHLGPQAHRIQPRSNGIHSQSLNKEAPPKDVDLVTKRLLSARLLKISELQNTLTEAQQRVDELQRENRLLRQLQLRQERALHRYSDTEGEIVQLISRHNNEMQVLRERLRRAQEKERVADRGRRDADTQLQRCQDQLQKLQQLANDQNLFEREELSCRLAHTQTRAQESERRVKELEKNIELSNGSFQRQLASERRRTQKALQEIHILQEEVERITAKLKEREKELNARNIYANRMLKATSKKEADNTKRKDSPSINSSKAVQTEDTVVSLDFPSPPPTMTDGNEFPPDDQADNYLSLKKNLQSTEGRHRETEEWRILELESEQKKERAKESETNLTFEREREKEKTRERDTELDKDKQKQRTEMQKIHKRVSSNAIRQGDEWTREEEDRRSWSHSLDIKEKMNQEDEEQWIKEKEIHAVEPQCTEQLMAKMHEALGQDSDFFSDEAGSVRSPPQFLESQNQTTSIFRCTEPGESLSVPEAYKRGGIFQAQRTSQDLDLAFGSYTPSFGKPAPRASLGPRNTGQLLSQQQGEENECLKLSGLVKDRKSDLMQQLFGSPASSTSTDLSNKMGILYSPSTAKPSFRAQSVRKKDEDMPIWLKSNDLSNSSTLHVSKTHPIVSAITSVDDDIEELTL